MKIKRSIECWVLDGSDGAGVLLLQVHGRAGEHEAFWQPITGGIEEKESPREACRREVQEETGLLTDVADLVEVADEFEVVISPELVIRKSIYTVAATSREITISPHEHQDHRWVLPEQVVDHLYWQSNKDTWRVVAQAHDLPVDASTNTPSRDRR